MKEKTGSRQSAALRIGMQNPYFYQGAFSKCSLYMDNIQKEARSCGNLKADAIDFW